MFIYLSQNADLGLFGESIDEWVHIHGYYVLYVFVPPLLFGEAMNLNWYEVKAGFVQVKIYQLIIKNP